jgi:hypothetical protein
MDPQHPQSQPSQNSTQSSSIIPATEQPPQTGHHNKLNKQLLFFVIGVPTLALIVFITNFETTRTSSRAAVPTPVLQLFPSPSITPTIPIAPDTFGQLK